MGRETRPRRPPAGDGSQTVCPVSACSSLENKSGNQNRNMNSSNTRGCGGKANSSRRDPETVKPAQGNMNRRKPKRWSYVRKIVPTEIPPATSSSSSTADIPPEATLQETEGFASELARNCDVAAEPVTVAATTDIAATAGGFVDASFGVCDGPMEPVMEAAVGTGSDAFVCGESGLIHHLAGQEVGVDGVPDGHGHSLCAYGNICPGGDTAHVCGTPPGPLPDRGMMPGPSWGHQLHEGHPLHDVSGVANEQQAWDFGGFPVTDEFGDMMMPPIPACADEPWNGGYGNCSEYGGFVEDNSGGVGMNPGVYDPSYDMCLSPEFQPPFGFGFDEPMQYDSYMLDEMAAMAPPESLFDDEHICIALLECLLEGKNDGRGCIGSHQRLQMLKAAPRVVPEMVPYPEALPCMEEVPAETETTAATSDTTTQEVSEDSPSSASDCMETPSQELGRPSRRGSRRGDNSGACLTDVNVSSQKHQDTSPKRAPAAFVPAPKVLCGDENHTTMMLRNIPNKYTRDMLVNQVSRDFRGQFDFVYLPIDFKNKCNVGYGFINFRTLQARIHFANAFDGVDVSKCLPGLNSRKVVEVSFARVHGLDENVNRLRNSPVMTELADHPEWMPLIFDEDGEVLPFPQPTEQTSQKGRRKVQESNSTSRRVCRR